MGFLLVIVHLVMQGEVGIRSADANHKSTGQSKNHIFTVIGERPHAPTQLEQSFGCARIAKKKHQNLSPLLSDVPSMRQSITKFIEEIAEGIVQILLVIVAFNYVMRGRSTQCRCDPK